MNLFKLISINTLASVLFLFLLSVACTSSDVKEEEEAQIIKKSDVITTVNAPQENKEEGTVSKVEEEVVAAVPTEIDGKTAQFTFDETEFNFGEVKEGALVRHTYTFTNTGAIPLVIEGASASCGCTVPNYPKEPIAPGAKSKIDVEFDTKGKAGMQNKTVTITANTNPAIFTLKLSGTVKGNGTNTKQLMGPVRQ